MTSGRHAGQTEAGKRTPQGPGSSRLRGKIMSYGCIAAAFALCLLLVSGVLRTTGDGQVTADKGLAASSASDCPRTARLTSESTTFTTPLGVNASGSSQLAAATEEFGTLPVIRVYYAGVPSPSEWPTDWSTAAHSAMVVSFNPEPAAVLSGSDDAALANFFNAAPRGHAIYYSFYPEPEAHIKQGQFTFAQYKSAWKHVAEIANKADDPSLHATLILQGQDANPGDEYNFRNYLPGGSVIAALGWDAYPLGTVDDTDPQAIPPTDFMGPDVAASRSVGLPFGFAEFALGTAAGRPQWLTAVARYLRSQGALFGTLFNAAGFPWMVLHDGASIRAWRAAVAYSLDGTSPVGKNPAPSRSPAPRRSPAPHSHTPRRSTPATPRPTPSPSGRCSRG